MKTIIAGSRSITDYQLVVQATKDCGWPIHMVISGHASGADMLGERWAREYGVCCQVMPANWGLLGKFAGHARNAAMAREAEALILIWDGKSKGSANMLATARDCGLPVFEVLTR